ncbi:MAG TPA: hypothetical protein VIK59_02600 [Verrucomicrobiae bacterium]
MDFCLSKLKLLLCAAAGAMIVSAPAQQGGQSIIFSTPQSSDASASAPKSSSSPDQPDLMDQQAPLSLFNATAPAQQLPMMQPPVISPAGQERMKQLQEDRNNWSLMSPEEIFGVATKNQGADGNDKNENQVERYLDRQNLLQRGATNDAPADGGNSSWNFSRNDKERSDAHWFDPEQTASALQSLSQLLGARPQGSGANPNNNSLFAPAQRLQQQSQSPKLDLAQQAEMERFRQLLQPRLASVAATPAANDQFFPSPKAEVDPNLTQPDFTPNPLGASFTPLSAGISRPTGLTPLPGIATPTLHATAPPSWVPQPPPWLSQGPQPFSQRNF